MVSLLFNVTVVLEPLTIPVLSDPDRLYAPDPEFVTVIEYVILLEVCSGSGVNSGSIRFANITFDKSFKKL